MTVSMISISAVKQGVLETWVADEIADLASTLPPSHAGLLLLDAQITDLETRCAKEPDSGDHKSGRRKFKPKPPPLNGARAKTARKTATKN